MVTRVEVDAAAARISGRVRRTPVLAADPDLSLKLEFTQHTGSFKARGAFNRILAATEAAELPPAGVVAASGGNAGLGFAYAARTLGLRAEIYVPATAPAVKVARLRALDAVVVQTGSEYAEAHEAATKRAVDAGALYCHAFDQPEVVAGQGTVAVELLAQTGGVDTVLVGTGGGGLVAGIAAALADEARVVAVEPELAPTLHAALAAGGPVDVPVSGVAVDSLGARRAGALAYRVALRTGVGSVLVSDRAIMDARELLWNRYRLAVEHGAAAAMAALASGAYRPGAGERVAVILSGANTDPTDLAVSR
jgi:threonine dehydratase